MIWNESGEMGKKYRLKICNDGNDDDCCQDRGNIYFGSSVF